MKMIDGYLAGCPKCYPHLPYTYGKGGAGLQRYICLLCGETFTLSLAREEGREKPDCPVCGKIMHIYQRGQGVLRFRCSDCPNCKHYVKREFLKKTNWWD